MIAARACAGRAQRMLEQHKQLLERQLAPRQCRDVAQEPTRRRQRQRLAGAIVDRHPPTIERRRHPPGQQPIGADQRRTLPRLGGFAQHKCQSRRLAARASGASISVIPAVASGKSRSAAPSRIQLSVTGAGRSARDTSALRALLAGAAACQGGNIGSRQTQRAKQRGKAELRVIFGGNGA